MFSVRAIAKALAKTLVRFAKALSSLSKKSGSHSHSNGLQVGKKERGWWTLFALKLNFNGVQSYKEILKFGYFKKWKKVRINLELAGCGNDIVLSIIDLRNVSWYQPCEKWLCSYL